MAPSLSNILYLITGALVVAASVLIRGMPDPEPVHLLFVDESKVKAQIMLAAMDSPDAMRLTRTKDLFLDYQTRLDNKANEYHPVVIAKGTEVIIQSADTPIIMHDVTDSIIAEMGLDKYKPEDADQILNSIYGWMR